MWNLKWNYILIWAVLIYPIYSFAQSPFITVWDLSNTSTPGYDLQIQFKSEGNFSYYWEDTNNPSINGSGTDASIIVDSFGNNIIDLPNYGTYSLEITPIGNDGFREFKVGFGSKKIIDVTQWGDIEWESLGDSFSGTINLHNITATDMPDLSMVNSLTSMFFNSNIHTVNNIDSWNVSNITDFDSMFSGASHFNQAINNWDVSNAYTLGEMFSGASNFNQPLNDWDVSSVWVMNNMFSNSAFNQPLNNWDVSNVTSMSFMFASCAFNQNINNWNVSNVRYLENMFANNLVFNQPLNDWDLSSAVSLYGMFWVADSFNQPLDNWNTSHITDLRRVFQYAENFDQSLETWSLRSISNNLDNMYSHTAISCENASRTLYAWANDPETPSNIRFEAYQTPYSSDITNEYDYLQNVLNWEILGPQLTTCSVPIPRAFTTHWNINSPNETIEIPAHGSYKYQWMSNNTAINGQGTAMGQSSITFPEAGTYELEIIPAGQDPFHHLELDQSIHASKLLTVEQWGDVKWSSMENAFAGANNLEILTNDIPNIEEVTNFNYAFSNTELDSIPFLNDWDMSNAISMEGMFKNTIHFDQSIENWDVRNVANMSEMFANASSFNQSLESWELESLQSEYPFDILNESGLDCENYSLTLYSWANNPNTAQDLTMLANGLEFSIDIEEYREYLIHDLNWQIIGDEQGSCILLSVENWEISDIEIYPNPSSEFVYLNNLEGIESIQIHNYNGQNIRILSADSTEMKIDISDLASGMYLLQFKNKSNQIVNKKIIKK